MNHCSGKMNSSENAMEDGRDLGLEKAISVSKEEEEEKECAGNK